MGSVFSRTDENAVRERDANDFVNLALASMVEMQPPRNVIEPPLEWKSEDVNR